MTSSELKLTPVSESVETFGDEMTDITTVGLIEYGLRCGCLDSEYFLALRLQEMRELAFELTKQLLEEGYPTVSDTTLKLLDVTREIKTEKRFFKSS